MINRYKDKYFSILGDSISTLIGYNPNEWVFYCGEHSYESEVFTYSDTWWGQVIDGLGGKLLVNNSLSGTLAAKHCKNEINSYGCSDERTSSLSKDGILPDVIMVFIGANDWGWNIDLGLQSDLRDITTFKGAYTVMLEKLKRNYPLSEIWCFTTGKLVWKTKPDSDIPDVKDRKDLGEFCKVIRDCAKKYGCRLIDLYEKVGFYDTFDGTHPNASGMKQISQAVLTEFR